MKRQVLVIHGGTSFDSYDDYLHFIKNRELSVDRLKHQYDWKARLSQELGDSFEVLQPRMPNSTNARYEEWVIWFERCAEFLRDDVILVGHSLGGIFLAKYLSERTVVFEVLATILVSAPYNDVFTEESLVEFELPDSLDLLSMQGGSICVFHSKDDHVVPYGDALEYKRCIPNLEVFTFEDRGHFNQEEFPELVALLKSL